MEKVLSAATFRGEERMVEIDKIIVSRELQAREDLDEVKMMAQAVAEAVTKREEVKPVLIVEVGEGTNRVIDGTPVLAGLYLCEGHRRLMGYKAAGRSKIPAIVRKGTWEDAVDVATSANIENLAMPRKPADKQRAVLNSLINHWDYTDRWHCEHCKVGHDLPKKMRPQAEKFLAMHGKKPEGVGAKAQRIGRDGKKQAATKKKSATAAAPTKSRLPWDQWEHHFNWISRFIDQVGLATSKGKEFDKAHDMLKEYGEHMKVWQEKLAEAEKAEKEKS